MIRTIILTILFAFAVLTTFSAMLVRPYTGKADPLSKLTREVSRSIGEVDQVGPAIGRMLDDVNIEIPKIGVKEKLFKGTALIDAELVDEDFTGKSLINANFNGAYLSGATFKSAVIQKSGFEAAQAQGVDFTNARLQGSKMSAGVFTGSDFTNANLRDAIIRAARMSRTILTDADLSFARFSGSDLSAATLENCYCVSTVFTNAILDDADLVGGDFSGARFTGVRAHQSQFGNANVHLADFAGCLLYTSPSPRDLSTSRMPSSA